MKRSTDRILTTHAGSLPRPPDLTRMMWDLIDEKPVDQDKLAARVQEAVVETVGKQREAGIDIVSDGEMSKIGFSNYVMQRYSGFANRAQFVATDLGDFPEIINKLFVENEGGRHLVMPNVEGPIELRDKQAVQRDIANFKAALGGASPDDAFIAAVTPGQMLFNFPQSLLSRPTRPISRPPPRRCRTNTRRSSMPASICSSTRPTCRCARTATPAVSAPPT